MPPFQAIIDFWFNELIPGQWWKKSADLDALIAQQFTHLHTAASRGELDQWRQHKLGRLAEIIVLDQFSRHLYRGSARAFASDSMALALAQHAVALNAQKGFSANQKAFLYLPFMHSESRHIHQRALALFSEPGLEQNLRAELRHKAIIDRFGRYPHRNKALGRLSSDEESEFLKQKGSSF